MRKIALLVICFALVGCATAPSFLFSESDIFSTENIMKVHQGMTSNEILTLFGDLKNISVSVWPTV